MIVFPWWYLIVTGIGLLAAVVTLVDVWRDYRISRSNGAGVRHAGRFLIINAIVVMASLAANLFVVEAHHHDWRHLVVGGGIALLAINGMIYQYRRPC